MNMNSSSGPPFGASLSSQPLGGQPEAQQSAGLPLPTSTEGTQQFCLRWNSYPATVATQLAELRLHEDFVDVTLACDGRQLFAHKLVLAACSPYFMQLFKSTPCQHPVIFLRDVGFRQLEALLDFMYAGEVNVSQVELPALLRTAEALQVRGLADTTANNNNNNNRNCPPQQQQQQQHTKRTFSPQYGQMHGVDQSNNTLPQQPPLQPPEPNQNDGGGLCMPMPCSSSNISNQLPPAQPTQQQQPLQTVPDVSSSTSTGITCMPSDNESHDIKSKMDGNAAFSENLDNKDKEDEDDENANDFEMLEEALGQSTTKNGSGDGNIPGQMDDTGQVFPDDPLSLEFDVGDNNGQVCNDNGDGENHFEEESSEVSDDEEDEDDDDDGECKEFTYQSDASYSQEGMGEGDGLLNLNGENTAGPSGIREPGAIIPKLDGEGGNAGGSSASARNRLSRSLWPPGIPYHGPQQCPYCTRVLSNVGNWRKHVLTMHFAREKIYKCRHCTSSFRTAEYLQKHYVRVHNYPQKMTRRKYVDQA